MVNLKRFDNKSGRRVCIHQIIHCKYKRDTKCSNKEIEVVYENIMIDREKRNDNILINDFNVKIETIKGRI